VKRLPTVLGCTPAALGAVLYLCQFAVAQESLPTEQEFDDILESLALTRRTGPMSLQFWVGRDGGQVTLPPRAVSSTLCVMEIIYFSVDVASEYVLRDPRGRAYWRVDSSGRCESDNSADIPDQRTFVSDPSISHEQVSGIITRTDEFLNLVHDFSKCGDIAGPRYLAVLGGEPTYIAQLERPSPSEPNSAPDVLIATLPTNERRGGLNVRFSMIGGQFVLHYACNYSPPQRMQLEDKAWFF
jgi:hypothetical protein